MNMRTRLHNCSSNNNSNNKHRRRRRLHRHHPHLHHWYNRHSDTKEVLQKTNDEHCQTTTMNHVTNCHLLYQKGQLTSSTVVIIHTCAYMCTTTRLVMCVQVRKLGLNCTNRIFDRHSVPVTPFSQVSVYSRM